MIIWILFREDFEICSKGLCLSKDEIMHFDNMAFCVSSLAEFDMVFVL